MACLNMLMLRSTSHCNHPTLFRMRLMTLRMRLKYPVRGYCKALNSAISSILYVVALETIQD